MIETQKDYCAAVDQVKKHDYLYFTLNAPEISDEAYDALYFSLQEYEEKHPKDVLADSPTQTCYSENGNGKRTVARRTPCLSMKKVHTAADMVKYLKAQQTAARLEDVFIDVEWKFDGETVALVYINGHLAEATYGHGKELMGNDCLAHIRHVQGVPGYVEAWLDTPRTEVRGEVIISLDTFSRYSKAGKSPRVTSNGIMSKKIAVAADCRLLEFHPFRLLSDAYSTQCDAMRELERLGFLTSGMVDGFHFVGNMADLEQAVEQIVCEAETRRADLPWPSDGLVFKFDDYAVYDGIGCTNHDAKFNCAFKFRPIHKAVTIYRGHHTTIGEKTGKVTYVADFDEVEMNGHRFAHANCGSERSFMSKGLIPGCQIEVSLHGDVIVCVDGRVEESVVSEIQEPEQVQENVADAPAIMEDAPTADEATDDAEQVTALEITAEAPAVTMDVPAANEAVEEQQVIAPTRAAIDQEGTPEYEAELERLKAMFDVPKKRQPKRHYIMVDDEEYFKKRDAEFERAEREERERARRERLKPKNILSQLLTWVLAFIALSAALSLFGLPFFLFPLIAGGFACTR
nr:MAG TPA: DNA ligase [Caudoviricetes sp.]